MVIISLLVGVVFSSFNEKKVGRQNDAIVTNAAETTLSTNEKQVVEELVDLYVEYSKLKSEYEEISEQGNINATAESFLNLLNIQDKINSKRNAFTNLQLSYYYELIGVEAGGIAVPSVSIGEPIPLIRVLLVALIIAVFGHFLVYLFRYAYSDSIKRYENYSEWLGIKEFTRVINWNDLPRIKQNAYRNVPRLDYDDAISINTDTLNQILDSKCAEKIAVVGVGNDDYKTIANAVGMRVQAINSVAYSAKESTVVNECDAVVLVVRVGQSMRMQLEKECEILTLRGKKLLGIIVFE